MSVSSPLAVAARDFAARHIGPSPAEVDEMLATIGADSLEALMAQTMPASIRYHDPLGVAEALSEVDAIARLRRIAERNQCFHSLIGQGYYGTILPPVIQRNILENPAWYTAYTPYQPEISQGRLEALLNFQTMVCELTALDVANASLLDEATAAAEAMAVAERSARKLPKAFFVDRDCHPQTIAVLRTRAEPLGWQLIIGDPGTDLAPAAVFGALLQYPGSSGEVRDFREPIAKLKEAGAIAVMAADP
ncbi:MAG: glycine dehydrogenase (aminomethyl-transferring), partial [Xanthomonadales bacterium]|nr:glycine dehydrogenase (aminomethyl-transferring) [Xanthomonadales bacterium]